MRITIHCEPSGGHALGGAELSVAVLAHALAADHDVRIVQHRAGVDSVRLGQFAALDLSRVDTRFVPPPHDAWIGGGGRNPIARYREAHAWQAALSRDADVFITFTHGVPPFCHARSGILVVLFPLFRRHEEWPWTDAGPTSPLKRATRRAYFEWEWRRRLASYDAHLSNSAFTQEWTRAWWGLETDVVHPPVDIDDSPLTEPRENTIISVGRFTSEGHGKKQLEMVETFARMEAGFGDWRYICAGAVGDAEADLTYLARVRSAATPGCDIRTNLTRAELTGALRRARLFWHTAGFGEPERERPERLEHFGMSTVEAMAAGCVPIVHNSGGPREIIEDGLSGFLWNSLDDLQTITRTIAGNDKLRIHVSANARRRARLFSTEKFVHSMLLRIHAIAPVRTRALAHAAAAAT